MLGDGDGTVNLRSALGCLRWRGKQKQAVYSKAFPQEEHLLMLQSQNIIAYIKKVVLPEKSSSSRSHFRRRHNRKHSDRHEN